MVRMKRNGFVAGLILLLLVITQSSVNATVKLPRLVSSGMVLQRDVPVKIWGWADPSEKITIQFKGETYLIRTGKKGNWQLELPAMAAGGPFTMKVNEIELNDILIGDVWLASGQSNMELPIRRVTDLYADEIARINTRQIRLFRSSTRENAIDEKTDYPDGKWLPATPENIMEFSAIAWFFANEIHQKYNVPIGIISTAIGGSPAEAWLSKEKVSPFLESWLKTQTQIDSIQKAQGEESARYDWNLD